MKLSHDVPRNSPLIILSVTEAAMAPELNGPVIGSRIAPTHDVAFPAPLVEVSGLPNGFPAMLDSPLAWSGRQFKRDSDYVFRLEEPHLIEIDHALQEFKSKPREAVVHLT